MKRGQTRQFPCRMPVKGHFVFVVLNRNEYLTLCEVEVYGIKGMPKMYFQFHFLLLVSFNFEKPFSFILIIRNLCK